MSNSDPNTSPQVPSRDVIPAVKQGAMLSAHAASQAGPPSAEGQPRLAARAPQGMKGTRSLPSSQAPGRAVYRGWKESLTVAAVLLFGKPETHPTAQLNFPLSAGKCEEAGAGDRGETSSFPKDSPAGAPHPPRAAQPFHSVPLNPTPQDAFPYCQGHDTTPSTKSRPRPWVAAGQQREPPALTLPAWVWPGRNRCSSVSPILTPPLPSFPFQCCEREVLESTL